MPDFHEQVAIAKRKEAARIDKETKDAEARRKASIRRRKAEEALRNARRGLFGRLVDEASPTMTHEEKALMCGLVVKGKLTDEERKLIPEFTLHVVKESPLKPVVTEFVRAGK
jgi:hypothetical protein